MSGLLDGVLPWIFSQGDTMKRNLRGNVRSLLEDPRGYAQSIGQDIAAENARKSQAAKALLYPSVMDEQGQQQAMQAMTETALNLLAPTVYHGSPHKFDRFDSSKIGTGEGAQAYGHGLYLAELPEVAKTYSTVDRPMLQRLPVKDGKPYEAKTLAEFKASNVLQATGDYEKALARIERDMDGLRSNVRSLSADGRGQPYVEIGDDVAGELRDLQQAKAALLNMRQGGVSVGPDYSPSLYKVDLPDDMAAKMLDWDKPLSQQPESVRQALESAPGWPFVKQFIDRDFTRNVPAGVKPNGQALSEILSNRFGGQDKAAEYLQSIGIPGIRYLDAGSRGAGKGSYNYVVFPGGESQLKILERNGKGLLDR